MLRRRNHISLSLFAARTKRLAQPSRSGLSLFEVVLAVSIFVGAMAILSQIMRVGSRSAVRANLNSDAIVRCERCMNEVISGVLPLESAAATPFADNPAWTYTVNVGDAGIVNLLRVEVIVTRPGAGGENTATFQLVRMVRDPYALIEPATAVVEEEAL